MGCSSSTQTESQGDNRPRAKPPASNGAKMHDESETIPDQTDLESKPDEEAVDQSEPEDESAVEEPPEDEPGETAPPVAEQEEVHNPPPAESENQAHNHEDAPPAEGQRSEEADPDMETEEVDTGYGADDAAADDAGDTQIDAPSFDE
ncbi:uncharacterized protein LOC144828629 [Lissotriton helveticus]